MGAHKLPANARVSLSNAQLQEGVGAELYSLCQGMAADGKVSKAEIVALGKWLTDNQNVPLPGIALLTGTLKRIIADGRMTREESLQLLEAVEQILPPDAQKAAKVARREADRQRKAAAKFARERQQQPEPGRFERRDPEDRFEFIVAGVHVEWRPDLNSYSLNAGERVRLVPEPGNANDDCAIAVTLSDGQRIGYVPRDDSESVADSYKKCGYYVARVKKILMGRRAPIPVVVAAFYRDEQFNDIADLAPNHCLAQGPEHKSALRAFCTNNVTMRRFVLALLIVAALLSAVSIGIIAYNKSRLVHVKGYYRSDGTYVQSYTRRRPTNRKTTSTTSADETR
jgi:hypothetical protein